MALKEIEFCLQAEQYELMGYPNLQQGQTLNLQLETDSLLPDADTDSWYSVQPEPVSGCYIQCGPARYAFAGQISDAEILDLDGSEGATLIVQCGDVPLRVLCGPDYDGRLPFGTWETRYLTGFSRINAIVEEDYSLPGRRVDVTMWSFKRLVLTPGDPLFGQWHETLELPPSPYEFDRVFVTAHLHRSPDGFSLD